MKKYNTILLRLLAVIIDEIVLYPITLLEPLYTNKGNSLFAIGTVSIVLINVLYFILLHTKYGYTIGKKITGLKVLDASESRLISLKKSTLRESPYILINLGIIFYVFIFFNTDRSKAEKMLYDLTFILNSIWVGLELIYTLSNKKRRAIHDLIANSVVINVNK